MAARWICCIFLWTAWTQAASAQSCPAIQVGNPDGNYVVPGSLGDVAYGGGLTMDVYAPKGDPRPAALIVRGNRGSKRGFVTRLYEQAAKAGYAWFAPDYRTAEDVSRALRFLRCRGRFNITDRVVLIGEDSGARIALELAAAGGVAGVLTVGAKIDRPEGLKTRPGMPVLMIHAEEDEEFPIAQAESLCRSMGNCSVYRQKGARHTFENWLPAQWDYREELDAWLRNGRSGLWKDIAYARPGGRDLLMDAWIPEGPGPFPAVVIAHGGGWEGGDKVTYVAPLFEPLAKAGIAWFSIDYTLSPYARNEQQVEEFRTAIRYVRKHAARYKVDPTRIAALGESASGQMVTQMAATPCEGCEVKAVVCFYGVYDFPASDEGSRRRIDRMFEPGATEETIRRQSPLHTAHKGMPPVLIMQGTADRLVTGSQRYAERLKELGVPSELVLVEGAPHGIENWEGHPEWAFWKTKLVSWLNSALR